MNPAHDVSVENHGTLHLVLPNTDEAWEWLNRNTNGTWWGNGVAVEPRYTVDLLLGMQEAGFSVPLEKAETS